MVLHSWGLAPTLKNGLFGVNLRTLNVPLPHDLSSFDCHTNTKRMLHLKSFRDAPIFKMVA